MLKAKKATEFILILMISFFIFTQTKDFNKVKNNFDNVEQEIIDGDFVKNRILIKYKEPAFRLFSAKEDFSSAFVKDFTEINFPKKTGFKNLFTSNTTWYKADLEEGTSIEDAINKLKSIPGVLYAEPDYVRKVQVEEAPQEIDGIINTNDDLLNQQYFLDAINIKETRKFLNDQGINPGGDRSTIVAVIDTGVDYTHSDLAPNMWINPNEKLDGTDTDGNGYIDDVYGVSTVGNEWSHTGDPMDSHGHGTHVAGIIAAKGNNKLGIRGVADNVRIMAIKASGSSGIFNTSDIVEAINYAVANGADVINMSFGGNAKSVIEMEALELAFNKAVLVASAGNNSLPNYPEPKIPGRNTYPAAYNFVIGVMASNESNTLAGFSNYDYIPQDSDEYEVVAPGSQIISTLPGDKYAKWDGTSMSAPIVSGLAALLKSYFNDPSSHSTRFIMGQIIGTANTPITIPNHIKQFTKWQSYKQINAINAFTSVPKPDITVFEHYIFDDSTVNELNNSNGVIDAGETVDLGFILRNHWGKADNVIMKIDTLTSMGTPDPYTTIITDTVDFGAVGTFNTDDNGLRYDENDKITHVGNPFKLSVSKDTPNDYYIKLNITITANNGLDPLDVSNYTFKQSIILTVRSGKELPSIIEEDMTLTNDTFWIIPNATLIPEGVTVNVEPGTSIQFWSNDPEDVYADLSIAYLKVEGTLNIKGTEDNPVKLFPSQLKASYPVMIFKGTFDGSWSIYTGFNKNNNIFIEYAEITNPNIGAANINHVKFNQNYNYITHRYIESGEVQTTQSYAATVRANYISNSIFYKMGTTDRKLYWVDDKFVVDGILEGNLFDSCYMQPSADYAENNVFLNNFILEETQWGDRYYNTSSSLELGSYFSNNTWFNNFNIKRNSETGSTYVKFNMIFSASKPMIDVANNFAKSLGGHLVDINSLEEEQFILNNFGNGFYIGLKFDRVNGYQWYSGKPMEYVNWSDNYSYTNHQAVSYMWDNKWAPGYDHYLMSYLIEIPGDVVLESLVIHEENIYIAENGEPYQIDYTLTPNAADSSYITFTSNDETIVTVDNEGFITPVSVGSTTITITSRDGRFTETVSVTVNEYIPLESFTLDLKEVNVKVGGVHKFNVNYSPANTTEKGLIWTSSNENVATVDKFGNLTALTGGSTVITVSSPDGLINYQINAYISEDISKIEFKDKFFTTSLSSEGTTIIPDIYPITATDKTLYWISSNPDIAYVNEEGFLVKLKEGTVTLRASSSNPNVYGEIIVAINNYPIDNLQFKEVVSTSENIFFALANDGSIWSWGKSYRVPTRLNLEKIIDIDANNNSVILLAESGKIYYQRYLYSTIYFSELTSISNVIKVTTAYEHFLALTSEGKVWGWGYNSKGSLGSIGIDEHINPLELIYLSDIVDIVSGPNSSFFLTNTGEIKYLGSSEEGLVVAPKTISTRAYSSIRKVVGDDVVSAFDSNNKIYELTANSEYQINTTYTNVIDYYRGSSHTLALLSDGTVIGKGNSSYGQLGSFKHVYSYIKIDGLKNITNIYPSGSNTVAINNLGKILILGNNEFNQLANLETNHSNIPNKIHFGLMEDTNNITLIKSTPTNGYDLFDVDNNIILEFNKSILENAYFPYIQLIDSNGIFVPIKRNIVLNKLYISPEQSLKADETYTIEVPEYAIKDIYGNKNQFQRIEFVTKPETPYVRDIVINEDVIYLSNNGLPYQIDYTLKPSIVDHTYVTWTSNDNTVVTVDEFGKITPTGAGSTTVTVTSNDGLIIRTVTVNVAEYIPLTGFEFGLDSKVVFTGNVYKIPVSYYPANTTEKQLTWSSSDENVATVDSLGNVTLLTGGNVTITAFDNLGELSDSIQLIVHEPVSYVKFEERFMVTDISTSDIFMQVKVGPETATNKNLIWTSSNQNIAYVDSEGKLIRVNPGLVVLRATAENTNIYDEIIVSVNEKSLADIKVEELGYVRINNNDSNSKMLARMNDNSLWMWGSGNHLPHKLQYENIIDIDTYGYYPFIFLDSSGKIYFQDYKYNMSISTISNISNPIKVEAGVNHYSILTSDGNVWMMKDDGYQFYSSNIIQIENIQNVIDIAAINGGTYLLLNDGTVQYLKNDFSTQIITNLSNVTRIESNYNNTVNAYTNDGKIYQISGIQSSLISNLVEGTFMASIGSNHSLYLTNTGDVYSYGYNSFGQLGNGTTNSYHNYDQKVEGINNVKSIYSFYGISAALTNDGELFAWGRNTEGQIANLTNENALVPTKIYFGLETDDSAIQIRSSNPANNEEFFVASDAIEIYFNKAVNQSNNYAYIRLIDSNNNYVPITKELALNKLTIKPNNILNYEETYRISIPSEALVDVFGVKNPSMSLVFKTAPEVPYVKDIILNYTDLTLRTNGIAHQIGYSLVPSALVDDTYISWSSSDESIVTVDAHGVLMPISVGSAVITVKSNDGNVLKTINVNVEEYIPLESFEFSLETLNMYSGHVKKVDANYNPINTTETELIWTSSDTSIAIVDDNGNITALTGGVVTITAKTPNGLLIDTITVNISEPVAEVEFTETFFITSLATTGEIIDINLYPITATDKTLVWESSNPNIAYVDENGVLVKVSAGNVVLRATSLANNVYDEIIVSVNDTQVPNLKPIEVVSNYYSADYWSNYLALMDDGTVWVWGGNRLMPKKLEVEGIIDIDAGEEKVAMLKNDGTIYYSRNYTINSINDFYTISQISDVIKVEVGTNHYLALTSDGLVWGWGNSDYGQLGTVTSNWIDMTLVYNEGDAVDIAAAANRTSIVLNDGTVKFLGYNNGNNISSPKLIEGLQNIVKIDSQSNKIFIAYSSTNDIYYFDANDFNIKDPTTYYLDNNNNSKSAGIKSVIISGYWGDSRFFLTNEGKIIASGYNDYGRLGIGEESGGVFDNTYIEELDNVVYINAGYYNGIAITAEGSVYVWGANSYGQLGDLTTENKNSPIKVNFGMYMDNIPLQLENNTPLSGEQNFIVDEDIILDYNHALKESSNFGNIKMIDSLGKFVPINTYIYLDKLIIDPVNQLKYNENYTLTVGSSSVMDLFKRNNNLVSINFKTELEPATIGSIENNGIHLWTADELMLKAEEFKRNGMSAGIVNNAILNNIIDPNTDTWMRFIASSGDNYKYLSYNYWGTVDEELIGKQIRDFEDYPDLSKIIYKPYLDVAPETAYPFVTKVYLTTDLEETTRIVGIGNTTYTVEFNRDMDVSVPLSVYFGPDYPYTDYKVEGDWIDARTWKGTFNITPLTGDGKQYFRIRDGRAADDHWLELGDDDGRFMFEIISSGTESMNLQATGAEGRIILTWMQDDFELLAGYDIYRSTTPDGEYVKINDTIVPKDELVYSDYNVEPGTIYYYKFKVVKTDLTDSDFSNIASSASFDTIAPTLYHTPVRTTNLGTDVVISATAYDNIAIENVLVYYRATGKTEYSVIDLVKGLNNIYTARINMSDDYKLGFEYYLEASDGLGTVYSGSNTTPHQVTVNDFPNVTAVTPSQGLVSGGDVITITGSNFKDGAKVFFADKEAFEVTYVDENTITAKTPGYYPTMVNVKVVNPTGGESILTNGFKYYSDAAKVQIPTVKGSVGDEILVPVNVDNVKGLVSADFTVGFDNNVLEYVGFVKGTIATRFATIINSTISSKVTVAMASDINVSGSGDLIYLKFKVLSAPSTTTSPITIENASLNSGNINVVLADGGFVEGQVYNIEGTIFYYSNSQGVGNVRIVVSGEKEYIATTDEFGKYSIQQIEPGSYTFNLEKRDETDAISAYDASMILRNSAGLELLNDNQKLAADVNNDGNINSFDASLVLQYVAGLRSLPFEGRTNIWHFSTNNENLENISENIINKNVTAMLIGDVSGNYNQTNAQSIVNSIIKVQAIKVDRVNNQITVPISIKSLSEGVYSIETTLYFDSSLTVETIEFSSELESYFKVVNTNVAGEVKIVIAGVDPLMNVDEFVKIVFKGTALNHDKYYFNIDNTMFNENTNIEQVYNVANLVYNLDLNNDGLIDQLDIDYILNNINKTHVEEDISDFDYNNDGIIDIYDIIQRQKIR